VAIQNAGVSSGVLVPEHGGLRQLGNWRTTRIAAPIYIIRYLPSIRYFDSLLSAIR